MDKYKSLNKINGNNGKIANMKMKHPKANHKANNGINHGLNISNQQSTLIILDWDDTLFPTSWVVKNNINLADAQNRWKYVPLFSELDSTLYSLLQKLRKYGKVIIITNAMPGWISDSVSVLPKTSQVIGSVKVLSARQLFQSEFNDMMEWKKQTFKRAISKEISDNKVLNIISIGDAEYEYRALIDLYNWNKKNKKILKSIKLIHNPTHNTLMDQLVVLHNAIPDICTCSGHIDWNFKLEN